MVPYIIPDIEILTLNLERGFAASLNGYDKDDSLNWD